MACTLAPMTRHSTPQADEPTAKGPLSGLKIVELGQLIAGPFAAKTLADFGAEVIKIEPPGSGDPLRKWRLIKDGTSVWWQVQSRNKQSLALDLRQSQAQAIVRELAAANDPGLGVVGLHLFSFGGLQRTAEWAQSL